MAGDFDASEPTIAELRAEARDVSGRVVTLLLLGTFPATARAKKLLYDATNHLANALSALKAVGYETQDRAEAVPSASDIGHEV